MDSVEHIRCTASTAGEAHPSPPPTWVLLFESKSEVALPELEEKEWGAKGKQSAVWGAIAGGETREIDQEKGVSLRGELQFSDVQDTEPVRVKSLVTEGADPMIQALEQEMDDLRTERENRRRSLQSTLKAMGTLQFRLLTEKSGWLLRGDLIAPSGLKGSQNPGRITKRH